MIATRFALLFFDFTAEVAAELLFIFIPDELAPVNRISTEALRSTSEPKMATPLDKSARFFASGIVFAVVRVQCIITFVLNVPEIADRLSRTGKL